MSKKEKTYVHLEGDHNMDDPNVIVPILYKYFSPDSVADYGCGIGNFLHKFKECGVKNVLGMDGEWSNNNLQKLKGDELCIVDLREKIPVKERFDMAISFEVAEHLEDKYADKIVNDLINLSDLIIFSAALPNQGGQNHLNEQWPEYWVKLFNKNGFICYDALRPILWNNEKIQFWYKQNMFIAINSKNTIDIEKLKKDFPFIVERENKILPLVHPDLFAVKLKRIDRLVRMFKGKASLKEYKEEFIKPFMKNAPYKGWG